MKKFFKDMVEDVSGHVNSKIFMGIVSFAIAVLLSFFKYDISYVIAFLSFSAGCFSFSCFDNKSAFQFKTTDTKTETKTSTSETNTTIDVEKIVDNVFQKISKKKK